MKYSAILFLLYILATSPSLAEEKPSVLQVPYTQRELNLTNLKGYEIVTRREWLCTASEGTRLTLSLGERNGKPTLHEITSGHPEKVFLVVFSKSSNPNETALLFGTDMENSMIFVAGSGKLGKTKLDFPEGKDETEFHLFEFFDSTSSSPSVWCQVLIGKSKS